MRNFRVIFILFIGSLLVTTSCKKGEDDPFLSLRSRDGRITGEWLISDIGGSETNKTVYHSGMLEGNSTTTVTSHSFSGFIWTSSIETTFVTSEETTTNTDVSTMYFNERITIEKDGFVTFKRIYESESEVSTTGHWYWVDSNKNKIGITFVIEGESSTFNIRQLKNKELVLETKESSNSSNSTSTQSSESEIFRTYEKQ